MKFIDALSEINEIEYVEKDLYETTFLSKAGEQVLSDLVRLYYIPNDVSLADSHAIAYQQGQSEVVHHILRRLTTIDIKEENDE